METHRRPQCSVSGCNSPAQTLTSGLCIMHNARMKRHGSTDDPRPEHYGMKRSHPFWLRWNQLKKRDALCAEWLDFWAFVGGISPQPEGSKKLARVDESTPYGPTNFVWSRTPTRDDNLAYFKAWRDANPNARREKHLVEKYDITLDDYNEAFERQGGVCAICNSPGTSLSMTGEGPKALAVDHDHHTDTVRELLCDQCNRGLGYFEDNPALISAAASYILRHRPLPKIFQYPPTRTGNVPFWGLKLAEPGAAAKPDEVHLALAPLGIGVGKRSG